MRKCLFAALFVASLVRADTPPAKLDAEGADALAKKLLADWGVPGFAVAIVRDDKVVLARGYGVRELGKPEVIDADTLFGIASCSKAFTCTSLQMLVADGKLSWNDPVQKHLPAFQLYDPYVSSKMTVRDLVTHRSGLETFSGDLLWYNTTYTPADIMGRLRYLKPVAGFRERFGYQNNLFMVAGELVPTVVPGTTWPQLVEQRIFRPLGMTRTTTSFARWRADSNSATPHGRFPEGFQVVPAFNADVVGAAAAVNTSANDITRWLRFNLGRGKYDGKTLLSDASFRELWQPVTPLPTRGFSRDKAATHLRAYGLGWFVSDFHGRLRVEHDGSLDGMLSKVAYLPEEGVGIAVLTNSDTGLASALVSTLLDRIVGVPATDYAAAAIQREAAGRARKAAEVKELERHRHKDAPMSLAVGRYAGTYGGPLYGDVTVALADGKFVLQLLPAPVFVADLEHWHHDTFRVKWRTRNPYIPDGWATFVLDRHGQVAELKLDAPNDDFDFTELELKRR